MEPRGADGGCGDEITFCACVCERERDTHTSVSQNEQVVCETVVRGNDYCFKKKNYRKKNIKETVVAAAAAMLKSEQADFTAPPFPSLFWSHFQSDIIRTSKNSHESERDRSPEENKGRQLQQKPVDLPSVAAVIARRQWRQRHYLVSCVTLKAAITRADICLKIHTPERLSPIC